jgi:RNA polymerase sigma-70 factor (ECF subfamily)
MPDDGGELAEVLAARKGDEGAFALLVRRRQGLVMAMLVTRVRSRDDAEDLAQEVFLRAWRRLPGLREPEKFAGWLARIAVNAALDHRRRAAVRPRGTSLDEEGAREPAADGPPGDHALLVREEFARVLDALGTLDARSQAAVVLRFREGLAVKDVAARLGDSPAATAMRLTRALRALKERLS